MAKGAQSLDRQVGGITTQEMQRIVLFAKGAPMPEIVIDPRSHDLGGGFEVQRTLPFRKRRMVGPFIFFDRMGPHDLSAPVPRVLDVRPHPHIGLSTVTYLFDGQITHRDNLSVEQVIRPGDLNWMTAGRGIVHSERFDGMREQGGRIDGVQAWVALPESHEEDAPTFNHYGVDELPTFTDTGIVGRLIAGRAFNLESSATTHSPLFYVDAALQPQASLAVPPGYPERAIYVARGSVELEGVAYPKGPMIVFAPGAAPAIKALELSRVMLLGGEPLGPRHIWWNFVSSRKERIEQAKADWEAGRIPLPQLDDQEFVPLPSV
jgi:redox-sensitive bicupin YhaK (pirin superfamily)